MRAVLNTVTPDNQFVDLVFEYRASILGEPRVIQYAFRSDSLDQSVVTRMITVGEPGGASHIVDRATGTENRLFHSSFVSDGYNCVTYTGTPLETGAPAVRVQCPDDVGDLRSVALLLANPFGSGFGFDNKALGPVTVATDIAVIGTVGTLWKIADSCLQKTNKSYTCNGTIETVGGGNPAMMQSSDCEGVMCGGICCDGECEVSTTVMKQYQ